MTAMLGYKKIAWVGVLISTLLLTGCGSGQSGNDEHVQANLMEAQRQAEIGQTAQAHQWADRAIAVSPQRQDTYIHDQFATTPPVMLSVDQVFSPVGDDPTLEVYMSQAHAKFPNNPWPLVRLTQVQGRLGDVAGQRASATALVTLLRAKFATPKFFADVHWSALLAQAEWDSGDITKADADFHSAIHAFPKEPDPYNALAYNYAVVNDKPHLAEALTLAQKAMSLATGQSADSDEIGEIQDTLGWVEYRQGNLKDAESDVLQGVNASPREAEGHYHLGMVYLAEENQAGARVEFNRAAMLSTGYKAAQDALAALPAPIVSHEQKETKQASAIH